MCLTYNLTESMKDRLHRLVNVVAVVVWMSVIYFLSTDFGSSNNTICWLLQFLGLWGNHDIAPADIGLFDLFLRKAGHASGYAVLYWLCWRMMRYSFSLSFRLSLISAFVLTALYAISDEIHQYFVPGRTAALADVLIDWLGAAFGALCAHRFTWNTRQNKPST